MISKIRRMPDGIPFTIIANEPFTEARMSLQAKGLLGYLLTLPGDWVVNIKEVAKHSRNGRDAHYAALRELKYFGYARLVDTRNNKGQVTAREWQIRGMLKNSKNPNVLLHPENPDTDNPDTDNPSLQKKQRNKHKKDNAARADARRSVDNSSSSNGKHSSDGFGFISSPDINPEVRQLCSDHAKLVFDMGWCKGKDERKGFSRKGMVLPKTLKHWEEYTQDMLADIPVSEMRRVWEWFKSQCRNKVAFRCHTMGSFFDKYGAMRDAMLRENGEDMEDEEGIMVTDANGWTTIKRRN